MITHTQTLTNALRLGPLKVKVRRLKIPESKEEPPELQNDSSAQTLSVSGRLLERLRQMEEAERIQLGQLSEAERIMNELMEEIAHRPVPEDGEGENEEDIRSMQALSSLEGQSDNGDDGDVEEDTTDADSEIEIELALDGIVQPPQANSNRRSRRFRGRSGRNNRVRKEKEDRSLSIVSSGAQYLLDKLRSEFKTVDVFGPLVSKSKSRPPAAPALLGRALDCHDAVTELKAQLDYLVKRLLKENGVESGDIDIEEPQDDAELEAEKSYRKDLDNVTFTSPVRLMAPGTLLVGTISIPGLSSDTSLRATLHSLIENNLENNDAEINHIVNEAEHEAFSSRSRKYELQIVRQVKDELGEPYYIARHVTDKSKKDDQVIIITMDRNALYYEDFETQCVGSIVSGGKKIIGSVAQLQGGQPGFFVPSKDSEHSFVLERTEQSDADEINLLRSKLLIARAGRALSFASWCGSVSSPRVVNERFIGRKVDWAEIVEDMSWLCEEISATMRRQVHILNDLTFEDVSLRKLELEKLARKGISRFQTHQNWDAATILLSKVKENYPSGSIHDADHMASVRRFSDQVVQRMQPCFDRFDAALRKASKRVCLADMRKWEQVCEPKSKTAGGDSTPDEDMLCVICCDRFELGKKRIVTTCEHAFHIACAHDWFKESSQCPTCRLDFSREDEN
eukprot:CAMPEP_0204830954 /NCGR_PEP_ID=MMETSP1346-20131115/9509_1 /ASSEMBLY_ACC=CAM_ASM_000771 /TAXON_ID=215587 /ORGANISM="Aplanochytrium stocchinoi, Strain GSBS06" /LENGTH=681 /DNA_ID=CAMNT_0051961579 /DNA_START=533 /DNA_END=2578 /DNA_ORIENTATION=-